MLENLHPTAHGPWVTVDSPTAAGLRVKFARSRSLQQKSHRLIPGGSHTYAKGDDQFPVMAPGFIARGKGAHVWDVDGNEYIEYGMGCRAVTLGHAFPEVVRAAQEEMMRGSNFTRPAPVEVECAEELLSLIDGADMVKFCKDGSTATSAAVKLARAFTGRDKIAFCSDQPFFSTYDWFIGKTPVDAGIPRAIQELSLTFRYNDIGSVRRLFHDHPGQIAGIVLEAAKYDDPRDGFLHQAKEICHAHGALFILDEMITGFRWHNGGAQAYYDIVPDLSAFGKALGNGFAVSALAGKRHIMELGGLDHDRERVFLLSTTHGAETHALAAAIATMRCYKSQPVIETLYRRGQRLKDGIEQIIRDHQLQDFLQVVGKPCCMVLVSRGPDKKPSQRFRSLLLQETIQRGIIMPSLVISYSHTDADVDLTVGALDASLHIYRRALDEGAEKHLIGRPSKVVFRKYN